MPNYISRGLPNDYQEANGYSTEAAYRDGHREVHQERTEAIIRMTFTEERPPRPYQMQNEEVPESVYAMYKAAFREQKRAPIEVNMTTSCEAYVLDMDRWYTATLMQLAHSTTLKWSPASHIWEPTAMTMPGAKAHIIAKVTTRRHCNDVQIKRIGTPHRTGSEQAEQVTTRHSRCSHVEIEHIGTSHTTVSQRADQVREVTRHQTTQKDDRIRQKIVWTEFHVKSEITITIPNHQWMPISIRRAKIHCYRATMASDNQCDGEVVDGATKVHSGR